MPAVRNATPRRPRVGLEHFHGAQIFNQPVGQRAVELQPVAFGTHAAVTNQVARIKRREQVLAGRHRPLVMIRQFGLQLEVERVTRLFVPEQAVGFECARVFNRGLQIKTAIGINGDVLARPGHLDHRLDALDVFSQRRAADFHFHHAVAEIEILLHLVLQRGEVLARIVITAGRVDKHLVINLAAAIALAQQAIERLVLDFRHRIPHRHVEHADGDRTLAVAAGLLIRHQRRPHFVRIEIVAGVIDQRLRRRIHQPRNEAFTQQPGLRITPV